MDHILTSVPQMNEQTYGLERLTMLYLSAKHKCTVLPGLEWRALYPDELYRDVPSYEDQIQNFYDDKEPSLFPENYPTFRYAFDATVTEEDQLAVETVLDDERAWRFEYQNAAEENADVVISFLSNEAIVERYSEAFDGLSVTEMNAVPKIIAFNRSNWEKPPKAFGGSREEYRQYLVMHEMGHAHGFGHVENTPGDPCPVMYQQTKGTGETICWTNPFPYNRGKSTPACGEEQPFPGVRSPSNSFELKIPPNASRFLVIPLTLATGIKGRGRHANLLLFDQKTRILERFDPNGVNSAEEWCSRVEDLRFHELALREGYRRCTDDSIERAIERRLRPVLKYEELLRPLSICPIDLNWGEQREGVDPNGFCLYWAVYYADLRLSFPDTPAPQVVENATKGIRGGDFFDFIRTYALFLDTLERLRESMGLEFEDTERLEDFFKTLIDEFTSKGDFLPFFFFRYSCKKSVRNAIFFYYESIDRKKYKKNIGWHSKLS